MDDLQSKMNELFSSPEGMEKIKNIVSMLSNSGGGDSAVPQKENEKENDGGDNNSFNFDPALLLKMTQAFSAMKKGDPRIDLLLSLKTNLSEPRRKKVDEAIQILRLINMMPLLREQGFLFGE